jgi:hypothetical protein
MEMFAMIDIPEALLHRIFNKKCILFLGAGATLESGGLLGADLAKYLYNQLGDTGVKFNSDLPRFTYNLVKKGFRKEIEQSIRERLKYLTPSKKFEKISLIPWKAIYTTNYDDLVEKSYKNQRYYEYTLEDPLHPKAFVNDSNIPLYKINGDINAPYSEDNPLKITLEDLKFSKKSSKKYINRLMEDFNDTFIFIGYSFSDKIITDILETFSDNARWESIKEKYIILPEISEDLKTDLEIYKIKYIKGTADNFFEEMYTIAESNYRIKLQQLKILFSPESSLYTFDPRTMNYITECFEFYNPTMNYPVDPRAFYRGGSPNWGIIKNNFDVYRELDVTKLGDKDVKRLNTESLVDFIIELSAEHQIKKLLLRGPAVSGKSTLIYRLAYELTKNGILSFLFKTQSQYRSGLLFDIYGKVKSTIVIIFDNVIVDYEQFFKMISDTQNNQIPAIFIATSRYSDWDNVFSNYNKTRLGPINYYIDVKDTLDILEAQKLVKKMIASNIINVSTKFDEESVTKKISNSQNIIDILLEVIDRSESVTDSICFEYDNLSNEAKLADGIVSLSFKYGLKLQWGLLKRSIEKHYYSFTWEDFVDKILNGDAKGNLFQEEIQGEYFISGRHRYISELILQIHYKGNYSEEIADIKSIIQASSGNDSEEHFVGTLINAILQNDNNYTTKQIEELLNFAIDTFVIDDNKAFINHLKGEFLLTQRKYNDAIACFDTNVRNNLNKMYSLHSMGKAYYYLAKSENITSGKFRSDINHAKNRLFDGIQKFPRNEYYYSMLLTVFTYLKDNNCLSEEDKRNIKALETSASENLNIKNISDLNNKVKDIM